MAKVSTCLSAGPRRRKRLEHGSARSFLLLSVVFLLGCGLSALWLYRGQRPGSAAKSTRLLSEGTLKVLARISSPVELRFYSILDPATIPESLKAFASRIDQLISAYEQQGHGNLKISRYNQASDANATTASADGIKPFNLEKGDACYLGISLTSGIQKEAIPRLDPDWEPALESDLTRAIAHVIEAPAKAASAKVSQKLDPVITDEVRHVIPNVESVSLEEGTRALREAALKEFASATKEMEAQIKDAEQRVKSAQSPAEQETAIKKLRDLQSEQIEKLKGIAAKSEAQIQTLQLLKQSPH
jgi:hypothetical protein